MRALILLSACTFGGLADYEIAQCTPNPASQGDDLCDRLNSGDGCMPWQCDAATRRCTQRLRDDDRDDDPPVACGGGDCDDHDPEVSSRHAEICDGKDNNCNQQIDEGVIGAGTPTKLLSLGSLSAWADPWFGGASGRDLLAAYVTASQCVEAVSLKSDGGDLAPECAFAAEKTLSPRQPQAALVGAGAAGVMVTTSGGCSAVRYSFANGSSWTQDCAGSGASLPSLAAFSAGHTVLVTWYATDYATRESPIDSCTTAAAADLRAVVLNGADSTAQAAAPPTILIQGGISVRPAALVAMGQRVLAAAPSALGIAVVPVSAEGSPGSPSEISGAAGARAVAMAAAPDGIHLAVAAEIGCTPQSIGVAFGAWDPLAQGARFAPLSEAVAKGSGVAVQPSITWIDARKEWLLTWIAGGPLARARRFAADGSPIGDAFDLGTARAAAAAADGNVYQLVDQPDTQIVQLPVGCH